LHTASKKAGVLSPTDLEAARPALEAVKPWKGVFDQQWVKKLSGTHVKTAKTKREYAELLMEDLRRFQKERGVSRTVVVWCASTEFVAA
jgi:myo-inositol-1-phosphate synthase